MVRVAVKKSTNQLQTGVGSQLGQQRGVSDGPCQMPAKSEEMTTTNGLDCSRLVAVRCSKMMAADVEHVERKAN